MIVIDNRTNAVYINLSASRASILLGVNRRTINRWRNKRIADGTNKEIYNRYDIFFEVTEFKR